MNQPINQWKLGFFILLVVVAIAIGSLICVDLAIKNHIRQHNYPTAPTGSPS